MRDAYVFDPKREQYHHVPADRVTTGPPWSTRCGKVLIGSRERLQPRPENGAAICVRCKRLAGFFASHADPRPV